MRKLSDKLTGFRCERPSEWMMDEYITDALALEAELEEEKSRPDYSYEAQIELKALREAAQAVVTQLNSGMLMGLNSKSDDALNALAALTKEES